MVFTSLRSYLMPHFETKVSLTGCGEAAFLFQDIWAADEFAEGCPQARFGLQ